MKTPNVEAILGGHLDYLLVTRNPGQFDFKVQGLTEGNASYKGLRIIHRCSQISRPLRGFEGMCPVRVRIVAQGDQGQGPFVFLWPPYEVDQDQCACNGMPLDGIEGSR